MKYIDLIERLPEKDKEAIENYIYTYGVKKNNFIGINEWLQNWSHSKQHLYKLLGEQFIVKIPISYKKSEIEIRYETDCLLDSEFYRSYRNFINEIIYPKYNKANEITYASYLIFSSLVSIDCLISNKTRDTIKFKKENAKKMLQIQAGSKCIKALQKVIEYFKDEYEFVGFEDFRIKHSLIFNDKEYSGFLCFSIHPFDFITMSDNDSHWSSCMSWTDNGCYKVGSIEMMNSNNTICCYIENSTPFNFYNKNNNRELDPNKCVWNNKRWRTLAYVTKDIIMCGKAYPYNRKELALEVITQLKGLARENLNWTYTFGPELYQDMKYLYTGYTIDRAHNYMKMYPKKHNIIWETKGMYNDMLNAKIEYWCIRNKVNKNKIISVSGKAPCLCCGNDIIEYDDWAEDYNDRYSNASNVLCVKCYEDIADYCEFCSDRSTVHKMQTITIGKTSYTVCSKCFKDRIKLCPCCGKVMTVKLDRGNRIYGTSDINILKKEIENGEVSWADLTCFDGLYSPVRVTINSEKDLQELFCCPECVPKLLEKCYTYTEKTFVYREYHLLPLNEYTDYLYANLKDHDLESENPC